MNSCLLEYQLFLFDFDGLLVDTEPTHFSAYVALCEGRGCAWKWNFEEFCHRAHGKAMGIWDALEKEYPQMFSHGQTREMLYEEKKRIYVEMLKSRPPLFMPGALELIEELEKAGIPRAVVTNSPREQIELIKAALPELQKISLWVTREDYARAKPAPDGYLHAIQRLGKAGDRIIGFEDTKKGLEALLAAGVDAVLVCPEHLPHVKECLALGAKHLNKLPL
ncbi:MAG: HAD family phosphatase [Verrucomicrobia bacterium]|nr:HAD family phosphatase [Verrucomicrobiota bacterium]